MNPALQIILIQFKPYELWILRRFNYLGCKIGALFNRVVVMSFYSHISYAYFVFIFWKTSLMSQMITAKNTMTNWGLNQVHFLLVVLFGWIVVWRIISCRFDTCWRWWVIWWWWTVTVKLNSISKFALYGFCKKFTGLWCCIIWIMCILWHTAFIKRSCMAWFV